MSFPQPRKAIIVVLYIVFMISLSSATDLVYDVEGQLEPETTHEFNLHPSEQIDGAKLKIIDTAGEKNKYEMQEEQEKWGVEVGGEYFQQEGLYRFKFLISDQEDPKPEEGYLTLEIAEEDTEWDERFTQLISNRPAGDDDFCSQEGDFGCELETYQAEMQLKAYQAYRTTGQQTYKEEALNFSIGSYTTEDSGLTCEDNDFDCESWDRHDEVDGAERQGALINSLWSIYSMTGNDTVRERAVNYTEAGPDGGPEECRVWEGEFDCGNATNQGEMIQGFWKAYEITGNQTFRAIATNLTSTSYEGPRVTLGLARAYRITQNETYRNKIEQDFLSALQECTEDSCTEQDILKTVSSGQKAYRATKEHTYYRNSILMARDSEIDCLLDSSTQCEDTDKHGSAGYTAGQLLQTFRNEDKDIYQPLIKEKPSKNETLRLGVKIKGLVEEPKAKLYDSNEEQLGEECVLNEEGNSCSIDHEWEQGVYYISYNSSEDERLIEGKKFPVHYTQVDVNIEEDTENLIDNSPQSTCDPWGGDYSCVAGDERGQSAYISGFSEVNEFFNDNETRSEALKNLTTGSYSTDEEPRFSELCLPDNDRYSCETFNDIDAGERQGSLIQSLYSSYSRLDEPEIRQLAKNYSSSSVAEDQDCEVWSEDDEEAYECRSSASQGAMIQAYWQAYAATGNLSYREVANELSNRAGEFEDSYELASGLWRTAAWNQDQTGFESASNMTDDLLNESECPNCDIIEYSQKGNTLLDAYSYTGDNEYLEQLQSHLDNRSEYQCIEEGSCDSPRIQGQTIETMTRSMNVAPAGIAVDTQIELSQEEIEPGDEVEAACYIENIGVDTVLNDIEVNITSSEEVFSGESVNFTIDTLEYTENATFQNKFSADEEGEGEIECKYESAEIETHDQSIITAESPDTSGGSSGGSSDEGEGSLTSAPEPTETEEEEENETFEVYSDTYEFENASYSAEELSVSEIYDYKRFFSRESCLRANRTYYESETILKINQTCYDTAEIVLIDDIEIDEGNNKEKEIFNQSRTNEDIFTYEYSIENASFQKPTVSFVEELSLEISEEDSDGDLNVQKETYQAEFELNRPETCELRINDTLITETEGKYVNETLNLREGSNLISLNCDDASYQKNVEYSPESEINLSKILLTIFVFGSFMAVSIKRNKLSEISEGALNLYKDRMFDYHFQRFKTAADDGEVMNAIEHYEKMSKHHQDEGTPRSLLESNNINLLRGIKVYLMSEMIARNDIEISASTKKQIESYIGTYIENEDDSRVSEVIRKNIEDSVTTN